MRKKSCRSGRLSGCSLCSCRRWPPPRWTGPSRSALGLTSDDPLPDVDDDTLRAYHRYLKAHLARPFEAKWEPEYGPRPTVKVTGLGDPEDDAGVDEMDGLLCQARAGGRVIDVLLGECEAKKGSPNRQLLKDYSYWFWNNR